MSWCGGAQTSTPGTTRCDSTTPLLQTPPHTDARRYLNTERHHDRSITPHAQGHEPLFVAASRNHTEAFRRLCHHGANLSSKDKVRNLRIFNTLYIARRVPATQSRHIPHPKLQFHHNVLHCAAIAGAIDILDDLVLQHGASVEDIQGKVSTGRPFATYSPHATYNLPPVTNECRGLTHNLHQTGLCYLADVLRGPRK